MCSVLLYLIVHIIIFHLCNIFISLQSCSVRLEVTLETVIDVIIDICISLVLSDHMCTLHIWLEKHCHLSFIMIKSVYVLNCTLYNECKSI